MVGEDMEVWTGVGHALPPSPEKEGNLWGSLGPRVCGCELSPLPPASLPGHAAAVLTRQGQRLSRGPWPPGIRLSCFVPAQHWPTTPTSQTGWVQAGRGLLLGPFQQAWESASANGPLLLRPGLLPPWAGCSTPCLSRPPAHRMPGLVPWLPRSAAVLPALATGPKPSCEWMQPSEPRRPGDSKFLNGLWQRPCSLRVPLAPWIIGVASEPKEKALALVTCAGVAFLLPQISVRCCRNIAQLSKVFACRQWRLIEIPFDTGKEVSIGDINFAQGRGAHLPLLLGSLVYVPPSPRPLSGGSQTSEVRAVM
ncbi:PREDICTED: uncharacterized protein LOC106726278 [Myotis brandtii]|uniref:uncharacterized protein LOC106726278 n=1 Tax=Myotis brandtii TaxID=109478 RepID=UPI000703F4E1|nr:PREDICTED: uncharacterized protein LOC106726278 [Myotis brandtii]XP_014396045.1 PREDICTED: uncharacterized protein LOC106726278 [Myotis brandtii]